MTDLIDSGWSSDCHKAPVRVVGGTEGTYHWECTKCGQSCNATNPGIDMAAPEPLANTDAANPPQAIEDKLKDHIAKRVTAWFGEPVLAVEEQLLAIITTETTKERLSLLKALEVLYEHRDTEPFGDFGDNLKELIRESEALLN